MTLSPSFLGPLRCEGGGGDTETVLGGIPRRTCAARPTDAMGYGGQQLDNKLIGLLRSNPNSCLCLHNSLDMCCLRVWLVCVSPSLAAASLSKHRNETIGTNTTKVLNCVCAPFAVRVLTAKVVGIVSFPLSVGMYVLPVHLTGPNLVPGPPRSLCK